MKYRVCLAILLFASLSALAQQMDSVPGQGRSMVVSKFGIVSTPQFLASQAGAHILEQGGNAIDAAIAANAVMGVVQPYVNGIGGDLFVLYYEAKSGKLYDLNSEINSSHFLLTPIAIQEISRAFPVPHFRASLPCTFPGHAEVRLDTIE
jgi:hypothetical protein